ARSDSILGSHASVTWPAFDTVTMIPAEAVMFAAASRATADSVWLPFDAAVVSHETEYAAVRSSAPRFTPSTLNWTPATPTLSLAVAVTETVPDTLAFAAGAVIATVGGVPSSVVKVKSAEVARLPAASRERTRK